jgi:hypothetical protein
MSAISSDPLKFRLTLCAATPLATRYFELQTIEFDVVNISGDVLFIETASLRFEADTGAIPNYVDSSPGLTLLPNKNRRITIDVRPIPLYKEFTNRFDVLLKYRPEVEGRLGKQSKEPHVGFYIIISTPPATLGDVFVSFKQPEDQRIANILERYAKRAGFSPHLFMRNPEVGTDQWQSIEQLINQCHSMFVVWGRRTEWGDGVGREIELCRKRRIREILLIENGVALPDPYHGTNSTYKRYDPEYPAPVLSEAVSSLRDQILVSRRRLKSSS